MADLEKGIWNLKAWAVHLPPQGLCILMTAGLISLSLGQVIFLLHNVDSLAIPSLEVNTIKWDSSLKALCRCFFISAFLSFFPSFPSFSPYSSFSSSSSLSLPLSPLWNPFILRWNKYRCGNHWDPGGTGALRDTQHQASWLALGA